MSDTLTRRAALATVTSTVAALSWQRAAGAADQVQVYVLDPDGGGAGCTHDCNGCAACRLHGANKLFRAGADVVRAHPGCRCTIAAGPSFPSAPLLIERIQ